MAASLHSQTTESPASDKLRWEPMKLVAVGTVAALLQASGGSKQDGGSGSGPKKMVGL